MDSLGKPSLSERSCGIEEAIEIVSVEDNLNQGDCPTSIQAGTSPLEQSSCRAGVPGSVSLIETNRDTTVSDAPLDPTHLLYGVLSGR
ncbi:Hypothetical protein FKW44_020976 [Caligus rogercresseyi]|uniref:Uncharacterized protein n=1 Tax=Caligus rogercresseyi TaxID=217165 RepID=A0A7T8JW25_CALRO|nr:Hypothetical protein FKW44_020976 [Caligus rogercresseyi]